MTYVTYSIIIRTGYSILKGEASLDNSHLPQRVVLISSNDKYTDVRREYFLQNMPDVSVDVIEHGAISTKLGRVAGISPTASVVIVGNCAGLSGLLYEVSAETYLLNKLKRCGIPDGHIIIAGNRTPHDLLDSICEIIEYEFRVMQGEHPRRNGGINRHQTSWGRTVC